MDDADIKDLVRSRYGSIAAASSACCAPTSACCSPEAEKAARIGYTEAELSAVPDGANLGLGCGNPQAIAALRPGEVLIDLGSGAGFDCFLAAKQVGAGGRVIGVDMTPDMVTKARQNARRVAARNVEFRLGEIEHLPVADASVDVILSNCVINLSPDKGAVFRDAFRVLRAGGRLAIADVVATSRMPEALANDLAALTGCIAGAANLETVRELLGAAGFQDIQVELKPESRAFIRDCMPGAEDYVQSATIAARRPGGAAACCGPSCCQGGAAA